ncbi:MAG: class I SAM-dependent DNA methyltransferase [Rhizobiales bacterium]|nr:class I SAM-dependent DNA methyltransferase [Hyphomicrobiales bacterium]
MSETVDRLKKFISYVEKLSGDEKGEAQVFCDRLFQAFGHDGYKEAGATLEYRVKKGSATSFADLMWKPRLLLEMKKRGEKLHLHYDQAFKYWLNSMPNRPRYVVLCNFDELWIYDLERQLNDPVDKVDVTDLIDRYSALNFLFPHNPKPHFGNDREAVSTRAATQMAELFRLLTRPVRPKKKNDPAITREQAQRYLLQLLIALFAEDIDLLPKNIIEALVEDCLQKNMSSYDLLGGLFQQMNNPKSASHGRYQGVRYFNGGLFSKIEPIELTSFELELIGANDGAAQQNWSKVNPTIFGTLFQKSMDAEEQHKRGAHYTSEADIQRIIEPTITRPWLNLLEKAETAKSLVKLRSELHQFRVLDPACGSGNFLYVAYRELARIEAKILLKIREVMPEEEFASKIDTALGISPKQFFGIELDPFGAELAKVTLMLAKKLAIDELNQTLQLDDESFSLHADAALPLDNLDKNIKNADALFEKWPSVDAIVGNPPYQSKNKLQKEYGLSYVNKLRDAYPEVSGFSDYCVYWFRKAHDHLMDGQRAGLVGTNTIRQNYSRESGLDYIVQNKGTITEAVSTMDWSGPAVVHVSVVNWIKGPEPGLKRLYLQEGNDPDDGWSYTDLEVIPSSLSSSLDVTSAVALSANSARGGCYQGQTHGHEGFLLDADKAKSVLHKHPEYSKVLFPFLIADDLIGEIDARPTRYVIDFLGLTLLEAQKFKELYKRVESKVLPDREKAAKDEKKKNKAALAENAKAKVNHHHEKFFNNWWQLSWAREDLLRSIQKLPRYIACGCVTKRPIFDFVSSKIHPNAALQVFPYSDDYSFGILQSSLHWRWFVERCSTLKSDFRYTSNTVFDSFPWPQKPTLAAISAVAKAAVELRDMRAAARTKHKLSLRELYRTLDLPGEQPLKKAQEKLDKAVMAAYGMKSDEDPLRFLLDQNHKLAKLEKKKIAIQGPGLPTIASSEKALVTKDCVTP